MLRMTSGLQRSVGKWVAQVAASVGATLVASMIYSALPRPAVADVPASPPELTSGGKFAARAIVPIAYDGLDTMPLPRVAPASVLADGVLAGVEPRRAAGAGTAPSSAPATERSGHVARPARSAVRIEPRRIAVAAAEPAPAMDRATPRPEPSAEDAGFMPRIVPGLVPKILPEIVSTAHEAWTVTASAGGSLIARVVPQLP